MPEALGHQGSLGVVGGPQSNTTCTANTTSSNGQYRIATGTHIDYTSNKSHSTHAVLRYQVHIAQHPTLCIQLVCNMYATSIHSITMSFWHDVLLSVIQPAVWFRWHKARSTRLLILENVPELPGTFIFENLGDVYHIVALHVHTDDANGTHIRRTRTYYICWHKQRARALQDIRAVLRAPCEGQQSL